MNISVELTLSPLQADFDTPIKAFIKNLRQSGLTIKENPLSTQVYGEYKQVMEVLTREIETTFDSVAHGLFYMKIVTSDRSNYEPTF